MIDFNDALPANPIVYDLDAIVARLRAAAEIWVPQHFPNGRRVGDEWRLANIRGAAPRKSGSCVIALKGERAGDWIDFDGGDGGGPLSTLEQATGLKGRELFAYAADLAGWHPGPPVRGGPAAGEPKPDRDHAREIEIILSRTMPLASTQGEIYLRSRGITAPSPRDLLFHPDLVHWETKMGFPALIGVVRDASSAVVALHRTYLSPDGTAKADIVNPKKMLGRVAGGAVRLAAVDEDGVLALAEGIETALAVMTVCPGLAVWAALSAGGLEQVHLPPAARRVIILADHDASGAGMRAAEAAARRLLAEGRRVAIAVPPQQGDDFNDVLRRDGPEAVRKIVEAAGTPETNEPRSDGDLGHNRPVGFADPDEQLPQLRADEGDLARAVQRTWALLLASNRTPWLFRAGGTPSWVVHDDDGLPVAMPVTEERMRHMLARLAQWRRLARNGDLIPAHPPTPLVKSVLAMPNPGLPVLAGIVTVPVFGRSGALLTEAGYHPDARLLYRPAPGFALPPVPERPTAEQIAASRRLIVDDMIGEFPFIGPAERAHAVALLLLGFLRAMIDGPTPLHLIEKPTPGTGATLMVDAIATVLTGAGAAVMTEGRDEEEWRKRITAKLRQIPSLVLIDNLRHQLDSSALAAALTAPYWEDRILGVSEMTRLPIRAVWIATGNNPEFSNEMARRLVRIRLDARVDQPWRRGDFRHPDLMGWVRANRSRLVAACLTLCRAWIAAGQPRGTKTIGSYEAWSGIMGGVLEVAGIEGFLQNTDEMLEAADGDGLAWRSFVSVWWDRFGTATVCTADLYELALACDPALPLGAGREHSQKIRLGKALGRMRDRVFRVGTRCVRIAAIGVQHQAQRWRLATDENISAEEHSPYSHDEKAGSDAHSPHSPRVAPPGSVGRIEGSDCDRHSPEILQSDLGVGEEGECGECSSYLHACADGRAIKNAGSHSQLSPLSLSACRAEVFEGESGAEYSPRHSPGPEPLSFDSIFEANGLDPLCDDDRAEATRLWLARSRGPPDTG